MGGAQILSISLAYVLPIALLAILLTGYRRRSHRWTTVILVALPIFYFAHYQMLSALQGWASPAQLPEEFRLIAFDIDEPGPGENASGQILLWVEDIGAPTPRPRVHRLSYERALHESLVQAGERQQRGETQVGRQASRRFGADGTTSQAPSISFSSEQTTRLPEKVD